MSTIICGRTELGWTFRGSAYCQLIRDVNKAQRLAWAQQYCSEAETGFNDVVWTDESSIQMETHKRFCFRKIGQPAKSKPRSVFNSKLSAFFTCITHRPKHPTKVHIWAGISLIGPTKIIIFEGTMDGPLYVEILKTGLLPFLAENFQQDIDLCR